MAIQSPETRPFFTAFGGIAALDGVAALAMTSVGELAQVCLAMSMKHHGIPAGALLFCPKYLRSVAGHAAKQLVNWNSGNGSHDRIEA